MASGARPTGLGLGLVLVLGLGAPFALWPPVRDRLAPDFRCPARLGDLDGCDAEGEGFFNGSGFAFLSGGDLACGRLRLCGDLVSFAEGLWRDFCWALDRLVPCCVLDCRWKQQRTPASNFLTNSLHRGLIVQLQCDLM